ncbi:hypothetical protein FVEN_g11876 [Fusarium venenatum]|uniref:uncharacterized protein n=1 Tax=Fusarium venenatum TaxID=56646 RepID=UPI001DC2FB0D|nr:hypothetical protein FVEN_g11876 [Fusarium venenatum]KAH7005258.1 hypothetical protein EDB82DRAFT_521244 [Fusarium venenatum]
MENTRSTAVPAAQQIKYHFLAVLPAGTLFGATVAMRLPQYPYRDVVIFSLLAMSGLVSVLVHASAFQQARLGRVAIFVALGCAISRSRFFTENPPSLNDLSIVLREYIFVMAVAVSVVAMMAPGIDKSRQLSDSIVGEEMILPPEPRNARYKPSTKQSWDLASSRSHLDLLSNLGSLDLKFMSGPKSHYSDHSGSGESAVTLSSGLRRDPSKIMEIIQWATAAAPPTFGRKGDSTSTETVLHEISA